MMLKNKCFDARGQASRDNIRAAWAGQQVHVRFEQSALYYGEASSSKSNTGTKTVVMGATLKVDVLLWQFVAGHAADGVELASSLVVSLPGAPRVAIPSCRVWRVSGTLRRWAWMLMTTTGMFLSLALPALTP
jgi:hypothetical protein